MNRILVAHCAFFLRKMLHCWVEPYHPMLGRAGSHESAARIARVTHCSKPDSQNQKDQRVPLVPLVASMKRCKADALTSDQNARWSHINPRANGGPQD
jgi:hypothetical protein